MELAFDNLASNRVASKMMRTNVMVTCFVRCPSLLKLLAFFPELQTLHLSMPVVGAEELAALGQAGPASSGVRRLVCSSATRSSGADQKPSISDGFWDPALFAALPGLTELDLSDAQPH